MHVLHPLQHGRCGIPITLVQRYSEELSEALGDTARVMEHIRVQQLHKEQRMAVRDVSSTFPNLDIDEIHVKDRGSEENEAETGLRITRYSLANWKLKYYML